jgi:hypothetical protein
MNREDIIRMAWKANLPSCHITHPKALERFFHLAVAHEREECAKVANAWQTDVLNPLYQCDCATAIRARVEK